MEKDRKERDRIYREENKEERNLYSKEYYEKNKEKINNYASEYRQENKERKKEYDKLYRQRNKERIREQKKLQYDYERVKDRDLKRKYNISLDDYNRMLIEQEGKCWTCSRKAEDERNSVLVVDHNHLTGMVRGLLCNGCNTAIGLVQESQEILQKISKYLHEKGACAPQKVG